MITGSFKLDLSAVSRTLPSYTSFHAAHLASRHIFYHHIKPHSGGCAIFIDITSQFSGTRACCLFTSSNSAAGPRKRRKIFSTFSSASLFSTSFDTKIFGKRFFGNIILGRAESAGYQNNISPGMRFCQCG